MPRKSNVSVRAAAGRGVRLGQPASSTRHADAVRSLLDSGLNAAQISRKLGLPYSTASQLVREIRASEPNQHGEA